MTQVDLKAEGIAYKTEDGKYAEFHSLRHSCISSLARSGAHQKVTLSLARYPTITLTVDHYSHTALKNSRIAYGTADKDTHGIYTHLYWTGDAVPRGNVEVLYAEPISSSPPVTGRNPEAARC